VGPFGQLLFGGIHAPCAKRGYIIVLFVSSLDADRFFLNFLTGPLKACSHEPLSRPVFTTRRLGL